MKKTVSVLGSLVIFILLTSCSTTVKVPLGHNLTAEIPGDSNFDLGFQVHPDRSIYLVEESSKKDPLAPIRMDSDFVNNYDETNIFPGFAFSLGLSMFNHFHFFVRENDVGLEIQLIGDPANIAKKGNFAFSILGSTGTYEKSGENINLGIPYQTLNGKVVTTSIVGSVLMSYRVSDAGGIGLNVFGQQIDAKGDPTSKIGVYHEKTIDRGAALQFFVSAKHVLFMISPIYSIILEPVRQVERKNVMWEGSLRFMF